MLRSVVYDIEVYKNYFLAAFRCVETGRVQTFELGLGRDFDRARLRQMMKSNLTVGFNSIGFDNPIVWMAINGFTTQQMKAAADHIIVNGMRPWEVERLYQLPRIPKWDHIDLIEVAPGQASLKIYGGRLHAPLMQDLPIEPDAILTEADVQVLKPYCINDLSTTELLMESLRTQIELREEMSKEFGVDMRSKSDAQVAEAVFKAAITKRLGKEPEKPAIRAGTEFFYKPPAYLQFTRWQLKDVLAEVAERPFYVGTNGAPVMPPFLEDAKIEIGSSVYRMGIGGLHSSEGTTAHVADEDTILVDRDVRAYYPSIILTLGLYPKHIGPVFLEVYDGRVKRRVKAKSLAGALKKVANLTPEQSAELKVAIVTDSGGKIEINGSFGKFGSKWSFLYSPDLLIQTTVTGQLALLMLIEWLEDAEIPVVSGNTDGIVIKCPKDLRGKMEEVIARWEKATGFETEETRYAALFSRDVNNYIAVKPDGEAKRKGAYAETGAQKNPRNEICVAAAVARIVEGAPVHETIRACQDIRQFVTVQAVQGGATKDGRYLGKAVRWYYAKGEKTAIHYKRTNKGGNHNKVPRTDGARPIMNLPTELPGDIDYDWYIRETEDILRDIGFHLALAPAPKKPRFSPYKACLYAAIFP